MKKHDNGFTIPSRSDIRKANKAFHKYEPRDLFYRAALDLVDRAIKGESELKLEEAIALLLQTWNRAYYRYKKFDNKHMNEIERLLNKNKKILKELRKRNISDLNADRNNSTILKLFNDFEMILGPVGAAKSLHLLSPKFFPLWDGKIAAAYGCRLKKRGYNKERYLDFMFIAKEQCAIISGKYGINDPLKSIDEFNYCKITKKWI